MWFPDDSPIAVAALAWAAVALDRWLGEPPNRWHPLVGFGRLAQAWERRANALPVAQSTLGATLGAPASSWNSRARLAGLAGVLLLVAVPAALAWAVIAHLPPLAQALSHLALLTFCLGARSLRDHVAPIGRALAGGDLARARALAGRIVSRDLAAADEAGVARAAVESTLENGNDAIFGALCWFVLAGGPGALAFRLANTLDAMWGYRTPRYLHFGWAAARLDDGLNLLPARLAALSYALLGRTRLALACWRRQASAWDSPNAGPVMAAGAGALGLALGGAASYHGRVEPRPPLGQGRAPGAADISRALVLVDRSLLLWLFVLSLLALVWGVHRTDLTGTPGSSVTGVFHHGELVARWVAVGIGWVT